MSIRIEGWPIVQMCFADEVTQQQFEQWLTTLSGYLQRGEAFVAVTWSEEPLALPDGYRQLEAVWYKQYKTRFSEVCKGLVRLAKDPAQFKQLNTPAMHKAWPCPYYVCFDMSDAMAWAEEKL